MIQDENRNQRIIETEEESKAEVKIRIMGMPSLIEAFESILKAREKLGECKVKPFSKELKIKTSDCFRRKLGTVVMNTEKFNEDTDMEEE